MTIAGAVSANVLHCGQHAAPDRLFARSHTSLRVNGVFERLFRFLLLFVQRLALIDCHWTTDVEDEDMRRYTDSSTIIAVQNMYNIQLTEFVEVRECSFHLSPLCYIDISD